MLAKFALSREAKGITCPNFKGNDGTILIKLVSGPLVVRHASKNFLLLSRKVTVPAGFDFPLTRKRWHLAQRPHRMLHFGA